MAYNPQIIGTGSYLPADILDNKYFEGLTLENPKTGKLDFHTSDEWITKRSGIKERRIAKNESHLDLAYNASVSALTDAGVKSKGLDGIIVATLSNIGGSFPSLANKLAARLGEKDIRKSYPLSYDLSAACSGFGYALQTGNALIKSGECDTMLIVAAEKMSGITNYQNPNCVLWGDGAGAAVLKKCGDEEKGILACFSATDPYDGKTKWLYQDKYLYMPEGQSIMKNAINYMSKAIHKVLHKSGWEKKEVDLFIPHQANIRILNNLAQKEGIKDRLFVNIEKYGNMSAATCAVGLDEARKEGLVKEGSKVIIVSFGAGLVSSATAVQF